MREVRDALSTPAPAHSQSRVLTATNPEGERIRYVVQHDAFYNPFRPTLYAMTMAKDGPAYVRLADFRAASPDTGVAGGWAWTSGSRRVPRHTAVLQWILLCANNGREAPEGYSVSISSWGEFARERQDEQEQARLVRPWGERD